MRIENSITIDRDPQEVWGYLADLENLPEWNYAIVSTRQVSPGPVGVGTVYEQERSIPERTTETLQITRFEPTHRLTVQGTLGPFHADVSYSIDEVGGASLLTNVADLEASGPLRMVAPLAARKIQRAIDANLLALKERLEAP